jgi:hypothetical protein
MNSYQQLETTRREYRMKGWEKSLYLVFGTLAVAFAIAAGSNSFSSNPRNSFPIIVPLFSLAFGVFLLARPLRCRLVIEGTRIQVRSIFQEQSADLSEIEGFRVYQTRNGSFTKLYLREGRGTITLLNSFLTDDDFRAWFKQITDLDKRDRDALLDEIAHEPQLGATPEERLDRLPTAKTWGIFITIVTGAFAAILVFGSPELQYLSALELAIAPIIVLFLLHRSPLLYAIFKPRSDPRAELSIALMLSSFGLLIYGRGIHFVSMQPLMLVVVPIGLVYAVVLYSASSKGPSGQGAFVAMLFFVGLYSFGLGVLADTMPDRGTAASYTADVIAKHVSRGGRSTSYYLDLSPWGPQESPNQLSVSSRTYNATAIGDQVCLSLHRGSLHAPWYQLVDCSVRRDLQSMR